MTTVDKHHIVNSHSSVGAIQVTDNDSSIKGNDGKVVVDEEIDSCEGEDYDEKMFQVALVNSVMDTGGSGNVNDTALQQAPGDLSPRSKARYALRKRRRPGEEPIVPQSPHSNALDLPNDPLNELQHVRQDNGMSSIPMPSIHLAPPPHIKIDSQQQQFASSIQLPPTPPKLEPPPPQSALATTQTHNAIKISQQRKMGVIARGHSAPGIVSKPPSSSPALLPSAPLPPAQKTKSCTVASGSNMITSNVGFHGNPSNTKKKASRKRKVKPAKIPTKTKVADRLSIPVPNPLLASTAQTNPSLNHSILGGRQDAIVPSASSVPCPLPVPSPLDGGRSTEVETPQVTPSYMPPFDPTKLTKVSETSATELPVPSRTRVFSIDLDPSTFDFSDLSSIAGGNADNKASADSDLPIFQGRDRAFSFEVFNFAGGDDLLPNPVSSYSMPQAPSLAPVNVEAPSRRPRGDSIIFDPSSFQDGGIHEKNALEKARLKDLLPIVPPQQPMQHQANQRHVQSSIGGGITGTYSTSQSNNPLPLMLPPGPSLNHAAPLVAGQNRGPHPVHSNAVAPPGSKVRSANAATTSDSRVASSNRSGSMQIATLPSSLSAGATHNTQSPPTFQMELLNKDGRIGIYLPEARRLRIARFHAKRKMRIWRKRIKYDCRKKLADSRPRIKGRFVKRSDMD